MEFVEASRAKGSIKKMLLSGGGSAQVSTGRTTRMLLHSPMDRPLQKLPWPLSGLQAHNVQYCVYEDEKIVEERTFSKWHIDDAIKLLLEGLDPSERVLIMPRLGQF